MSDRERLLETAGQSTTEYVVLMGVVTSVALVVFNALAGSVREVRKAMAHAILSSVTGTP